MKKIAEHCVACPTEFKCGNMLCLAASNLGRAHKSCSIKHCLMCKLLHNTRESIQRKIDTKIYVESLGKDGLQCKSCNECFGESKHPTQLPCSHLICVSCSPKSTRCPKCSTYYFFANQTSNFDILQAITSLKEKKIVGSSSKDF